MFAWDKADFMGVLGVLPVESNDFGANYEFDVSRGPVTLSLGLNADTGDCSVFVRCQGQQTPVFEAIYLGSPGARVVLDKRGSYIELGAPSSFEGSYDSTQPLRQGLRLRVEPSISVESFGFA